MSEQRTIVEIRMYGDESPYDLEFDMDVKSTVTMLAGMINRKEALIFETDRNTLILNAGNIVSVGVRSLKDSEK